MATSLLRSLLGIALFASVASAGPVPVLDVARLTADADFILIGTITVTEASGEIAIDQTLKGIALNRVRVRLPQDGTAIRDAYRLFFLKASGSEYEFANPYYPSLPAIRETRFTTLDPLGRVFEALRTVVRSNAPLELKQETIGLALMGARHAIARSALRDVLTQGDDPLWLLAAGALLAGDDMTALPFAEMMLPQTPTPDSWVEFLGAVQSGLRNVRNEAAIPTLTRLLARGNADTRRAAADALRFMRSPATIGSFVAALDDTDVEVRHSAVLGLAETTGQLQWGPSLPAFAADPNRYISYWKEWARTR